METKMQDTWFTDQSLPIVAISGSVESDRVLQLHFRRPVTDQDRLDLTEAMNLKILLDRGLWSPMDSAPKDGSDFLAYLGEPPNGDYSVIYYSEPSADAPSHCWHKMDGLAYHRDLPTAWRPLPEPPPVIAE